MADRCLIQRRERSVPLPNMMNQEIASATNRALFHQHAPTHIRIMNPWRNAMGAITAIIHQNPTAEMPVRLGNIFFTAARTVHRAVVDIKGKETCEWLKIHTVPLVRNMGNGTEGLQKMQEEFQAENEGIPIPTQVR
jgi:gentisate 1,2-dioxygenase